MNMEKCSTSPVKKEIQVRRTIKYNILEQEKLTYDDSNEKSGCLAWDQEWRLTRKGKEGPFWSDDNVSWLVQSGGYTGELFIKSQTINYTVHSYKYTFLEQWND